ncbi:MAG: hypothetical protein EOM24_02655 [Chloroflexia bacterium]|nr:hypothetical protein [Chloroflexia bacterium]
MSPLQATSKYKRLIVQGFVLFACIVALLYLSTVVEAQRNYAFIASTEPAAMPQQAQLTQAIAEIPVPSFKQRDYADRLGSTSCGLTIASHGCTITSLAMVYNYHQPDYTNPPSLNNCISERGGFSGCLLNWGGLCAPEGVSVDASRRWQSANSSEIDSYLQQRLPVIVGLGFPGQNSYHWVVIIGKRSNGLYITRDPESTNPDRSISEINSIITINGPRAGDTNQPIPTPTPGQPPPPPPAPNCAPQNLSARIEGRTAHLDWADVTCAGTRGYTLHVTRGSGPEDGIILDTGVTPSNYSFSFPEDGTYSWHVASWQGNTRSAWSSRQIVIGGGSNPPPPPPGCGPVGMVEPHAGATVGDSPLFRWEPVSCAGNTYVLRVKTVADMHGGGETVLNRSGIQDTVFYGKPEHFPSRFYGRTLYWSVIPEVSGGQWSPARPFVINPNRPPAIGFASANGQPLPAENSPLWANQANWLFAGTASDTDGRVTRVELRCERCEGAGNLASENLSGTSWQHERHNMMGQNLIAFVATDDKGASVRSRLLDLRIDLTAPTSTPALNGETNPSRWRTWYNTPQQLHIRAVDGGNGQALSQVREVRTWLRGPGLDERRTWPGSEALLSLERDGVWTIEYQALDNVGNLEVARQLVVRIDRTPPTPPAEAQELGGASDSNWQRDVSTPVFRWSNGSDAGAGLARTELRLMTSDGRLINTLSYTGAAPPNWSPAPEGLPTGSYNLLGRSVDHAGNASTEVRLFTFRYDRTPPANPSALIHAAGVENERWQRTACQADFSWARPHDEGSGVAGYEANWRIDDGSRVTESSATLTSERFQSDSPPCDEGSVYTNTLFIRTRDAVGNLSERTTAFTLRYDNDPPTVAIRFSGGITETTQTRVTLELEAADRGSGVAAMRFSGDGSTWTEWEAFAPTKVWQIPGISHQSWPVYVQVRDHVGLSSEVAVRAVKLNVNRRYPRSANFRLFASSFDGGSAEAGSASFFGRGTLGQGYSTSAMQSTSYVISSGYETALRALPLLVPGSERFTATGGSMSAGTGAMPLSSGRFQMQNSIGQAALPNNQTTLSSQQFQHRPGFLADFPISAVALLPVGPEPELPPTPACPFATIQINGGANYTQQAEVNLTLCAPFAETMRLSSDPTFADRNWEPYAKQRTWRLTPTGESSAPRTVYVWFRNADGTILGSYSAAIIYDAVAPVSSAWVEGSTESLNPASSHQNLLNNQSRPSTSDAIVTSGALTLQIIGQDTVSGLSELQFSEQADFADAVWMAYDAQQAWTFEGGDRSGTLYVRSRDRAGNISEVSTIPFVLDTTAPYGSVILDNPIISTDTTSVLLYLEAEDNGSGIEALRVSSDPGFGDAAWQPYRERVVWTLPTPLPASGTIYVQFRDEAGNLSEVYAKLYVLDTTAPRLLGSLVDQSSTIPQLSLLIEDDRAGMAWVYLSNDPAMVEGVAEVRYTDEAIPWVFDPRQVVWVMLADAVGNRSEPYAIPLPVSTESSGETGARVYLPSIMR